MLNSLSVLSLLSYMELALLCKVSDERFKYTSLKDGMPAWVVPLVTKVSKGLKA